MVIVDASVAVKWVVDEPDAQAADALLEERMAAPSLWLAEATNALWSKCRRKDLTEQDVLDGCETLARAPVTKIELELLLPSAAQLALALGHPVYDCFYLAAAQLHDTQLITADRRFARRVADHAGHAAHLRLLGDWAEGKGIYSSRPTSR
jgi:predicted nucleic acid-binding protein